MPQQKTVGVRLGDDLQVRLKKLSQAVDRSPHYLMREAIESYVSARERQIEELRITNERWEAFALTGEVIEHEDMEEWAQGLVGDKR